MSTIKSRKKLEILPDSPALAQAAAERIVTLARQSIAAEGRFTIALSGGTTPLQTYRRLAAPPLAGQVEWRAVQLFWGDERCVPPNHSDSNYRMALEALGNLPILPGNIHRMCGESDPEQSALDYETELRNFFGSDDVPPRFDLVLLGMGEDGHTASIFPNSPAIHEPERWVVSEYVEKYNSWRVTLTPALINAAANVIFLVSGENKSARLKEVLEGVYQPNRLPAQLIAPENGTLWWLIDEAAASKLQRR